MHRTAELHGQQHRITRPTKTTGSSIITPVTTVTDSLSPRPSAFALVLACWRRAVGCSSRDFLISTTLEGSPPQRACCAALCCPAVNTEFLTSQKQMQLPCSHFQQSRQATTKSKRSTEHVIGPPSYVFTENLCPHLTLTHS